MMQLALMPLGLVLKQVPLFSCSTRSAKLSLFQKSAAVVMIVDLTCIKDCKEWRERVHARDKLNIQVNAPSVLLPQSSVQKGSIFSKHAVITLEEISA